MKFRLIGAVLVIAGCLGGGGGGGGGWSPPEDATAPLDMSAAEASAPDACVPRCEGRACGSDGCGGSCGACVAPRACNDSTGACEGGGCNSQCSGRQCGSDGCGGACGTCPSNATCDASGRCQCVPRCDGRTCGSDGCGGSCGACTSGQACDAAAGRCVAMRDSCNDNTACGGCVAAPGCGWCASSGTCTSGSAAGSTTGPCATWRWGTCAGPCVPACDGRNCGIDRCGGTCGSCRADEVCSIEGRCNPDRNTVVAASGMVSATNAAGSAWDVAGGLPDPLVCLTLSGVRRCSRALADTRSPMWNAALFTGLTGNQIRDALRAGYRMELLDEDVASNDTICEGTITDDLPALFDGATFGARCTYGSVTFRIDFAR